MTDFNEHINDLIIRQLCGDITAEEQGELQQWTSSSADNERYYLQQRELWFSATDAEELAKYNKEAAYERFRQRVATAKEEASFLSISEKAEEKTHGQAHRFLRLRYAAVAAALLCLVGFFAYRSGQQTLTAEFADIVIEAPQGSRTQMTLPDGSRVWLNAGSKIAYSQGFGLKDRIVRLVLGEGYFEVARNERLPFSVSSENLKVEVLGTKFNFRDYPDDAEAIVSLQEGSVALSALNSPLTALNSRLTAGQSAIYNKHTGKMTIQEAPVAEASQWTQGILVFNGEPLPDIVRKLERSYNVKITLADKSLSELRFHGDFTRMEQSLREVLDVLAATGRLRYEIAGNQVTIYSK